MRPLSIGCLLLLALRRGDDGRWLIAADMDNSNHRPGPGPGTGVLRTPTSTPAP